MAFVKVSECLTNPRELIKLILLVVCVCITLYQLSECVNKILHPPITSYYKFRHNTSIKYPALTICRKPSYKKHLFPNYGVRMQTNNLLAKDVFKSFDFEAHTIEEFLNNTTYSHDDVFALYGYNGSGLGENVKFETRFYPVRGQCHTIIPKEPANVFSVTSGYWLYLYHSDKTKTTDTSGLSSSGFEIFIHNENDVIKSDAEDFLFLESAENMRVTLTVQTFSIISTAEQPCVLDSNYSKSKCEEKCVHNNIAKEIGCTVPWLRHLDKKYPPCTNASVINQIANLGSIYGKKCVCQIACNNSIYSYQVESRRDCDAIQAPSSTISIYYPSNLVTDLTEVISYDWTIFIADVGGSLGFLLGLSVIGFINIIEEVVKMICKSDKSEVKYDNEQKDVVDEKMEKVMEYVASCDNYQYLQEIKKEAEGKY